MKLIRKICVSLLVLSLVVGMMCNVCTKEAKAAGYETAAVLPVDGNWTSNLHLSEGDNKEHWYRIDAAADGMLNLKLMNYAGPTLIWKLYTGDMSTQLLDDSIYGGTETSPRSKEWKISLKAGTYYLNVSPWNGTEGTYRMCNSFTSYRANDMDAYSYDSPQTYTFESVITGGLGVTDKEDWFRFTVSKKTTYVFKMTQYGDGRIDWGIKNWDLTDEITYGSVYGDTETSPGVMKKEITLEPGTYYLKISLGNSWGGKYTFVLNKLTQKNCDHDYNSSWHDATYFKRGYRLYKCEKCGHSYEADYVAVKILPQGYIYSYSKVENRVLSLEWSGTSDASGYQIRYGTDKKMKSGTVVKKITNSSKTSLQIKGLTKKKTYYVQVRAYKKSGGKVVYGKWSAKRFFKVF